MPSSSEVICDGPTSRDATGIAIRKLLKESQGKISVASPYVSGDPKQFLGLSKGRWKDLILYCDLDSGNCNPRVLKQLLNGQAILRTVKGLHAKVYLTKKGAAVGSANLTPNGLGTGTIEAVTVVRGSTAIDSIEAWFQQLERLAQDASVRLRNPSQFEQLLANWKAHQSGHKGQGKASTPSKPSLLKAIKEDHPTLKDVSFHWYTHGGDLQKSEVKDAANRRGIWLPKKATGWEWFESQFQAGHLKRLDRFCRGKPLIAWGVRLDDDEDIAQFLAHDSFATPFLGGFRMHGTIVSVVGDYSAPTPFDLRADRSKLAKVLTSGLARAGSKLKRAINDDRLGMFSVSQLKRLVKLGLRSK